MLTTRRPTFYCIPALLAALLAGCAQGPARAPTPAPTTADGKPLPLSTAEKRLYNQAAEKLKKQQFNDAVELLEDLVEDRPELTGPRVNLALAYLQLNKPEPASTAAETALELNPDSAEAHFVLALVDVKENRYRDAEQRYNTALKINPDAANIHYNLALLYDIYFQQPAEALPHYKKYLELSEDEDEKTAAWVNHLEYSLNGR